ncbi:MAG: hypothetical protein OEY13_12160 [Gammaproteobacteria bacterium]|nr:hypothetical protein [Gammaproteobacteria bacterium]MDH4311513.1 hypothetical protein [Gammaproteobacteria bacterium]MDH5273815.1 hypothetical protein [Gammaproteobacteria bacterium]
MRRLRGRLWSRLKLEQARGETVLARHPVDKVPEVVRYELRA